MDPSEKRPIIKASDPRLLDRKDLEDTIIAAFCRAEEIKLNKEEDAYENDGFTKELAEVFRAVVLAISILLAIGVIICVLSFFGIYPLDLLNTSALWIRIALILLFSIYSVMTFTIWKALRRVTNRLYLIVYMSALTSIAALIVSLVK